MKLTLGPGKPYDEATAFLKKVKLRKARGVDLDSAMTRGGFYAKKLGKPVYVYRGNSYMQVAWQAVLKKSDALNMINNTGDTVYVIDPSLVVTAHEVGGRTKINYEKIDYDALPPYRESDEESGPVEGSMSRSMRAKVADTLMRVAAKLDPQG